MPRAPNMPDDLLPLYYDMLVRSRAPTDWYVDDEDDPRTDGQGSDITDGSPAVQGGRYTWPSSR